MYTTWLILQKQDYIWYMDCYADIQDIQYGEIALGVYNVFTFQKLEYTYGNIIPDSG